MTHLGPVGGSLRLWRTVALRAVLAAVARPRQPADLIRARARAAAAPLWRSAPRARERGGPGRLGIEPVVLDLATSTVDEVASVVVDHDAVVFAAGTELGAEAENDRKDEGDRAAAIRFADAAAEAAVRRCLMMSSIGVNAIVHGPLPDGLDERCLRAEHAAEEGVTARPVVDLTVVRPGRLTDTPGTGRVGLGSDLPFGSVPWDDVAAALLDTPSTGAVLDVVAGSTPVDEAVAAVL